MPRAAIERPSRSEDGTAADAANHLRVDEGVTAANTEILRHEGGARQLDPRRARFTDVLVLRVERNRIERPQADQIVEVIREVGRLDRRPVASEALLDAGVESARSLWLQIWIAEEARRGAVRLDEQRLLDATSDARTQSRAAKVIAARGTGVGEPRHCEPRRCVEPEAAVVFEPHASNNGDALGGRFVLQCRAGVVTFGPLRVG